MPLFSPAAALPAVPVLVSHARQISSGDLAIGDLATDSDDEIGELDRSFAEMVAYLREMAAHSEAIASGDLCHRDSSPLQPGHTRHTLSCG